MLYTPEQLAELNQEKDSLLLKIEEVKSKLLSIFVRHLLNKRAIEYVQQGVCRRLGTIKRSIENIYAIFPPERTKRLERNELDDVQINLHALLINIYGVLDNLAWIYVHEHEINPLIEVPNKVGLFRKDIQPHLPPELVSYLATQNLKNWYEKYAKNYRDALAHRIPMYVPPFSLTMEESQKYRELDNEKWKLFNALDFEKMKTVESEKDKLGSISNAYMHSYSETDARPVALHPQIIADGLTIIEITELFHKSFRPKN